ncbi:MAG: class I SAM-dependent RNA methyltransferase [Sulfitobacter litoralis]|jgi:putative N6-adenine-specific DNA methylase|uniref:N6-adenine-specific DNA methylase n=1 Tax=Sulfitobacter litoralis TaxID=335975 RepID=A0ABY0SKL9_9RHOB|nr:MULTISPECIES: N-6 DNA methylase [Sulfitobacter]MBQ0715635.1 class I SAM-dependent RNA methyltransferase [Sulfitobacter litoralis]MBQ0766116.1 class I SAM-dependent RNA methyltransferase [Sulfitobacter litoralis]MBQ0801467.1 class I SAM-dependent RNA methyltransferase [Sulfitobacter litoralis]MCF7725228.1 class I SAM-dependent RNA methyltransferase [Sulfitobacter sp. M22]MCF7776636.1 class I SAM-dependent RNA methyltransferase [Sulfitobacter sp. M220]|tara:strand:- start:1461 stop:2573 length:1113 start_codon:yes stop_codon:yes gene_type:complete
MDSQNTFDIFIVATPGLEDMLLAEVTEKGFANPVTTPGGITVQGDWPEVWRANLQLRGASRVLARIGSFMAFHLAQLDKRARKFPWGDVLRADVPLRVQVTTKASKIYHAGAATQRIETALRESLGVTISPEAALVLKVRIDDNVVTISLDTSGESLHKRGHKEAVGKAPMRENLAYLMLRQAGYTGTETVVDPMCGSGTFVIEAAEIAMGLNPGRSRHFAFEDLASFDPDQWAAMRDDTATSTPLRFYGSDRDAGAVRMSRMNAERAGVSEAVQFENHAAGELTPPDGPPGLVMVNPPYGGRIGNKKLLYPLYGTLGQTLLTRFKGWRVGLVTSEPPLAKATGLPWKPQGPAIAHGGMKVWLYQTPPLR